MTNSKPDDFDKIKALAEKHAWKEDKGLADVGKVMAEVQDTSGQGT